MAHVDVVAHFNTNHTERGCVVGLRLFDSVVQVKLDLGARTMVVSSTDENITAPLPLTPAGEEVADLRILVDGAQFEIFGLGGRANVALGARLDYNASSTLGTAFADCGAVRLSVQVHEMDTAYEDDE
jgi:hypothetical protein